MRRVAAVADAFEIPLMPHVRGTVVAYHASMQMGAVLGARLGGGPMPYPFIEIDVTPNPMLSLLGDIPIGPDGTVTLTNQPGLGFELDAERFARWTTARWTESLAA